MTDNTKQHRVVLTEKTDTFTSTVTTEALLVILEVMLSDPKLTELEFVKLKQVERMLLAQRNYTETSKVVRNPIPEE